MIYAHFGNWFLLAVWLHCKLQERKNWQKYRSLFFVFQIIIQINSVFLKLMDNFIFFFEPLHKITLGLSILSQIHGHQLIFNFDIFELLYFFSMNFSLLRVHASKDIFLKSFFGFPDKPSLYNWSLIMIWVRFTTGVTIFQTVNHKDKRKCYKSIFTVTHPSRCF